MTAVDSIMKFRKSRRTFFGSFGIEVVEPHAADDDPADGRCLEVGRAVNADFSIAVASRRTFGQRVLSRRGFSSMMPTAGQGGVLELKVM